jgi:hypothetical protein
MRNSRAHPKLRGIFFTTLAVDIVLCRIEDSKHLVFEFICACRVVFEQRLAHFLPMLALAGHQNRTNGIEIASATDLSVR